LAPGSVVEREELMSLMRGRSPVDGAVLREMGRCSTVAAIDLTLSAPKSVSVLFAVAEPDVLSALLEAHERAIGEAREYLEPEACWTRRGRGGAERVRGDGFVAAAYRHRMSRAGDSQRHTQVVVANLTRAAGRYTALDAHALYEHKSAAGALYRAVLQGEVRERLPWVSWRPAGRGLFEIDRVPDRVLRHFSPRRVEIEDRAAELTGASAAMLSRERMQGITLATRQRTAARTDRSQWRDQARARAAEQGFGGAEIGALIRGQAVVNVTPDLAEVAARLSGSSGLTEMHNTFTHRHALAEIAGSFPDGATAAQLDAATDRYLSYSAVIPLEPVANREARFTTESLLTCERAILDGAQQRRNEQSGVVPSDRVAQATATPKPALNEG